MLDVTQSMHNITNIRISFSRNGKHLVTDHKNFDEVHTYLRTALEGVRRGWSAGVSLCVTWDDDTKWYVDFGVVTWKFPSMAGLLRRDLFHALRHGTCDDRRGEANEILESYEI